MTSLDQGQTRPTIIPLEPIWKFEFEDFVHELAVSPDGRVLAVGGGAGIVALVDSATGGLVASFGSHFPGLCQLKFSADSRRLATVGHDGNLKIWDSSTGGLLAKVRVVQRGSVEHLVWVGQDRLAVAGGKALRIMGQDGTVHHSVDLKTAVLGLALSTDENPRLAVATYGSMWLLNPATGEKDAQEWQGTLIQPVWSPTGRHLAVGTQERSVQIWQSHPPDRFQMTGYESKIRNISWDGTGRYMATDGAADCAVWDFSGKGPRGTMPIVHSAHQRLISAVAFRPRGIRFATGGLDGLLAIWDLRRPIPGAALIRNSPVSRLVWSPDGDFLYAGFEDGLVLSFSNPKESFS